MKKLKRLTATFLVLLTILSQPVFAVNKVVSKVATVAGIAAGSIVLTAGAYAATIRQMVKSKAYYISKQDELTPEVLIKCDEMKNLLRANKFLFTKNEIKYIENLVKEKNCDFNRLCVKDEYDRLMKEIGELYLVETKYRSQGDMESWKYYDENEIQWRWKRICELESSYNSMYYNNEKHLF